VQLHWYLPNPANPARNWARDGLDRISEKWMDFGFSGTGVNIRCNSTIIIPTNCDCITAVKN